MSKKKSTIGCPLCDWEMTVTSAKFKESNRRVAPAVAAAMGVTPDALFSIHQQQNMRRDEIELEQHLETHGPRDWLPKLMEARKQAVLLFNTMTEMTDLLERGGDSDDSDVRERDTSVSPE